jgi:hypothetical protein
MDRSKEDSQTGAPVPIHVVGPTYYTEKPY